jgi:2-keto-4-pentenoate hydratase/2-oxohepta-3-ene-1,7-dioic acid hydratase in catechol pathway
MIRGDTVVDVSAALDSVPAVRWPIDPGDLLIANLERLRGPIQQLSEHGLTRTLRDCSLKSPVANPTKIIGAPANYSTLSAADSSGGGVDSQGLFLKANTSLIGPSDGIELALPGRQHIHEVELAVVIGSWCRNVGRERALDHVAGYAVALDMTVAGGEDRSWRKSPDGHCVLGPWLVTHDSISSIVGLDLWLQVNGEPRQRGNTRDLICDVPRLIEIASSFYTLYPGDILLTGTPPGAAPVVAGDVIDAGIAGIGSMRVWVR